MKIPTKLTREWEAKLKASGFQDLEMRDRDMPLSDRGLLHAVTETPEADVDLAWRAETGLEYTRWAQHILHTRRFRTSLERSIWEHHANGDGLATTAKALGVTYHDARDVVNAIKARRVRQVNQVREAGSWPKGRKAYRALSWETSVKLAAALLRTLMPSLTRGSASSAPTSLASARARAITTRSSASRTPRRSPATSARSAALPARATAVGVGT